MVSSSGKGGVTCDVGHKFEPAPCILSLVLEWRICEGVSPSVSSFKAVVGLKDQPQTDFPVIRREKKTGMNRKETQLVP